MKYKTNTLVSLLNSKKTTVVYGDNIPSVETYKKLYELYFKNHEITITNTAPVNIYIGCIPDKINVQHRYIIVAFNASINTSRLNPKNTVICAREKVTYHLLKNRFPRVFLTRDVCFEVPWNEASKLIKKDTTISMPQICLAIYQKRQFIIRPGKNYVNAALYDMHFRTSKSIKFYCHKIHYVYILLRRDPVRERNVYLNCSKLRSFIIFDAVDGKTDAIEENFKRTGIKVDFSKYKKDGLLRAQYGCFFSHYNVWKLVYSRQITHCVIMEDDTAIPTGYEKHIASIVRELPVNYDYCHLLTASNKTSEKERRNIPGKKFIVKGHRFGNLAAYMISQIGAKTLMDNYQVLKAQVDHQIHLLREERKLKTYSSYRNVMKLNMRGFMSNIGNNGIRKFSKAVEPVHANIYG